MAKGQRKQAREKIDKRQFEQLCGIQCTEEEIMAVFDVSKDTLIRWCKDTYGTDFATIFKEKRRYGCASLRRNQWRLAEENVAMSIWLGKQYLGQTENQFINTRVSPDDGFLKALGITAEKDWSVDEEETKESDDPQRD